jgi:hypothetical protein
MQAKAYTTRVGAGPYPTEIFGDLAEELRRIGAEYGTTTGRPRRVGWLDIPALRYATRCPCLLDTVSSRAWGDSERDTILNCFLPTGLLEGSASIMPCRSVLAPTGLSALWVRDFCALEIDMRCSPGRLVVAAGEVD